MLPTGSLSNFAIRDLALPCSINGISPDILFQFNAKVNLINPVLTIDCNIMTTNGTDTGVGAQKVSAKSGNLAASSSHCSSPQVIVNNVLGNNCRLVLTSTVSVEPVVHVQTVRRTLFCVNACEGLQPCQGSVFAAAIEDSRDCEIGGVDRPDCRCSGTCDRGNDICDSHDRGDDDNDDIAGISRCVAKLEGFDVCDRKKLAGIRRGRCDGSVLGIADRICGAGDRDSLEKILKEILEELSDGGGCDVAGVGFDIDGTFGISDKGIIGAKRDIKGRERSAFKDFVRSVSRLHGSNGCSW